MENTLVFTDDGFFRLLKNYFEKQTGSKKRLLKTFRNICNNEKLNLNHLFFYSAPPYQSEKPSVKENKLKKDINQKRGIIIPKNR